MQDTVRIRIHGCNDKVSKEKRFVNKEVRKISDFLVPEHNQLYISMLEYEGKYFHLKADGNETIESISPDDKEDWVHKMTNKKWGKHGFESGMMVIVDENKVKKFYKRFHGSYRVPSSFGGVTFSINKNAGYIDFELSIPKYLFGHSLAQFVPQPKSTFAIRNFERLHDVWFHFDHLYDRFMKFLDRFFMDLCYKFKLDTELNKKYIEVLRVDFCFNQFFKTAEDANEYHAHQQDMNVRRYKNNANVAKEYGTSLTYSKADGCFFKIYNKGAEYVSSKFGDLKKHEEINYNYLDAQKLPQRLGAFYAEEKGILKYVLNKATKKEKINLDPGIKDKIDLPLKEIYDMLPFKTVFLKDAMDRVLRYESSIKNTYMSSLYKRYLFRRKDAMHRVAMVKYLETKKKYDSRYEAFQDDVTFKEKRNFDAMNNYMSRGCHFMLETNTMLKNYEQNAYPNYDAVSDFYKIEPWPLSQTILSGKDIATFSPELFRLMFKSFWKEVKYYQVENVSNFDDLVTRIKQYNRDAVKNANAYNEMNGSKVMVHNANFKDGRPVVPFRKVKKATQLLTQKEMVEKGFKKVSVMHMVTILRELEKGKKLRQIFVKLGFSANQRSRFRKDLEIFGINDRSVMQPKKIDTNIDFRDYYAFAGHRNNVDKFYTKPQMSKYG
ncbi:hypothetical protein [Muricauda sp. MAR_2010_75]|uniref:hypothetical protein n=1 Tax=Allomuricauda sp. MAR_2010_75 TaxID=1250232 RepID=UPI00056C4DA8|nr:hypothetical protein [Muricauda sp. MAR_2010_75]